MYKKHLFLKFIIGIPLLHAKEKPFQFVFNKHLGVQKAFFADKTIEIIMIMIKSPWHKNITHRDINITAGCYEISDHLNQVFVLSFADVIILLISADFLFWLLYFFFFSFGFVVACFS